MSGNDRRGEISAARAVIDAIDSDLVRLLNARAAQAATIGDAKRAMGEAIYQPEREARVFAHAMDHNDGPLSDGAIRRVFERILDEARRLERLTPNE
jgi:chorismate mutase